MPKRNATSDAINALSANDEAAMKAKEIALAAIPDPVFVDGIAWTDVFADKAFNVRAEESYDWESNQELYNSLKTLGLQTRGGDNMSFSRQADGRLKVLTGNLRYTMMKAIREDTLKDRNAAGEPTGEANPLPFESIKGLVFDGLSYDQELDLMADHTMKKGLNEAELAKEIGELTYHHGLTDAKAAVKFGMDKNKIARLRMKYTMPTVYAEFRIEKGKDKTKPFLKVGQVQTTALYTAYLNDVAAGNAFRQEGPNFRKAWEEFKRNPGTATETVKVKSKDKDTLDSQRNSLPATFGNNPEVQIAAEILAYASNEPGANLNTSMEKLVDLFVAIRKERDEAIDASVNAKAECDTLRETVADRDREIDGLKADADSYETRIKALESELEAAHKPQGKTKKS